MNVNQVYSIVLYAAAKNKQDGYISPDDFNLIINQAQDSYLDYLKGEYQKYQIRRPISVVEFGENQMIRQSLAALIYSTIIPINNVTGIGVPPSDYEFADAMWGLYGFYNIRFIQQDRLDSYYHSTIDPIASYPVYYLNNDGFNFLPTTIGNSRLSYVRTPPPITWGYDEDGNGLPVYNAAKSQQPVWADTDLLQIIVRALALVGVNLQTVMISQYANEIKQGGQ